MPARGGRRVDRTRVPHLLLPLAQPLDEPGRIVDQVHPAVLLRRSHLQMLQEDLWSMAECLQHQLDGYTGSNSEINDYYLELLKLSNL